MNKTLLRNIVSLFGIQGFNYLVPLVTLPYLVRVLSPEGYGALGFSLALVQYLIFIVDYGFNLSATQSIALNQSNKKEISKIFWNVCICRLILCILAFLILISLTLINAKINSYQHILYAAFSMVIGTLIFPVWLFQGKEKMGSIAIISIISKVAVLPLVFIFVKSSDDSWIAALITGSGSILAGLLSLFLIYKYKWISWVRPQIKNLIAEYKNGWHLFLSTAAISLYTTSITVILGFMCGPLAVGYFVAADKLRMAAQGLIVPVSQAMYPRINAVMSTDKEKAFRMIHLLLYVQGAVTFLISLSMALLSPYIITWVYGYKYLSSIPIFTILSCLPFIVGLSNVMGIQTLLVMGYRKIFSNVLVLSGVFNLIIIYPLILYFNEIGAAISVVSTEIVVVILMTLMINIKKIPIFRMIK